jgi:RNA polymerase sigma factor (sigma-70 family)
MSLQSSALPEGSAVRATDEVGDPIRDLWVESKERLWRSIFAYSGDRDVADDAVAEAYTQCVARGDQIINPEAWIWRTAFRLAGAEMKRRRMEVHVETEMEAVHAQPSAAVLDVLTSLKQLSPNQRAVVVLHDYADRPPKEIAETLRMSRATVYVHLSEARRKLRRELDDWDE